MLLFVIRHAEPIYNPDSLTEKGKRQAEALSRRLAVHGLDRIYSSPMNRALQTAQPTCEVLGKNPEILPWASEDLAAKDFGFHDPENGGKWCWSFGINPTRYKLPEVLALGDKWYEAFPFNLSNSKEGYERIKRESDAFTESLGYKREGIQYRILKPSEERVALFCHYGFGTTFLSYILGIPPVLFWSTFDINHSGVTVIEFQNHENGITLPKVLTFSEVSHLYADRLPYEFTNRIGL